MASFEIDERWQDAIYAQVLWRAAVNAGKHGLCEVFVDLRPEMIFDELGDRAVRMLPSRPSAAIQWRSLLWPEH